MKKIWMVICFFILFHAPACNIAFGAESEEGSGFPWATVITIAFGLLAAVASTTLAAFKKALNTSHEALKVVSDALQDNKIDDDEIKIIIAKAVEMGISWKDFIIAIGSLFKKRE